jgi:DNA modification methylase
VRPPDAGEATTRERTWNPEKVLETSDRRAIYFDPRTESKRDGMPAGLRVPMDVWYGPFWGRIQGNNKERRHYHDNQLPETYLERVVLCSSNEGDLVLDPFLGSGTTGVVAHALKRRFVGTEFSAQNAKNAYERMKDGPIRPLGQPVGMSTAIHPSRRKGSRPVKAVTPETQPARRKRSKKRSS